MTGAEDRLYCGCRYEQALLQAYLVRRGLLGPVSSWKHSNISNNLLIFDSFILVFQTPFQRSIAT